MIKWNIEKRKIDDLKPFENNPRNFTEKGLKDLKKSIESNGDANIITINADNTVLGGHARLKVMQQMGIKEVDVKCPETQLSDKQAEEIVIRLNANTAGEWDLQKLQADFDLDELTEWGLDVAYPAYENLMKNEDLQEYNTDKRLALQSMPISSYLCILFDNVNTKQDFIQNIAKKHNCNSNVNLKTQYCTANFNEKNR